MLGSYFSFSGRTGRLGYFAVACVQLAVLGVGFAILLLAKLKGFASVLAVITMFGGSAWLGLAGMVRRIRDMGWPMVITLVATFVVPMFSLLLLIWPGKPTEFDAASVFSDDPEPTKPHGKDDAGSAPAWMQKALAQVSAPKSVTAVPSPITTAPRVSGAMAAAAGPRAEFGLRRSY